MPRCCSRCRRRLKLQFCCQRDEAASCRGSRAAAAIDSQRCHQILQSYKRTPRYTQQLREGGTLGVQAAGGMLGRWCARHHFDLNFHLGPLEGHQRRCRRLCQVSVPANARRDERIDSCRRNRQGGEELVQWNRRVFPLSHCCYI